MPGSYDFLWSELGIMPETSGANLGYGYGNKCFAKLPYRFSYLCWNLTWMTIAPVPKQISSRSASGSYRVAITLK